MHPACTALTRGVAVTMVAGCALVPLSASPADAASSICVSHLHPHVAAKLSHDIIAALHGRRSYAAVSVYDRHHHIACALRTAHRFDSASVVKVTILAALARRDIEERRHLTKHEASLAHAMITRSDNDAASALWRDVGRSHFKRFLKLARMTRTVPGHGQYWGLTQITAGDQYRLLKLLTAPNHVLGHRSRGYILRQMHEVITSQRWGVTAGTPKGVSWHVKNGWLPRKTRGWRINSIGSFHSSRTDYMMAVLSDDNSSMGYGVSTVQRVARAVQRDLNPHARVAMRAASPDPSWGIPDEQLPEQPTSNQGS